MYWNILRAHHNDWRQERDYELLPNLIQFAYGDHLTPMVLLSINTGIRRGELFDLRWKHFNRHTPTLTIEGETAKSGKTRHIPLNNEAMKVLAAWSKQTKDRREDRIFAGKNGARRTDCKKAWNNVLEKSKITQFRWHDLRHHFASKLATKGVPLNTVRELLGHADLKTTLRYAHLAPDHKADAVALLND